MRVKFEDGREVEILVYGKAKYRQCWEVAVAMVQTEFEMVLCEEPEKCIIEDTGNFYIPLQVMSDFLNGYDGELLSFEVTRWHVMTALEMLEEMNVIERVKKGNLRFIKLVNDFSVVWEEQQ